jgi:hypothetical protein
VRRLGVAIAIGLAVAGCQSRHDVVAASSRRPDLTLPHGIVILDSVPDGAIVLGDIDSESELFGSASPDALHGAMGRAVDMGANAVFVESEWIDGKHQYARVKALRVSQ